MSTKFKQSYNANIRRYTPQDIKPTCWKNKKACAVWKIIYGEAGREKTKQACNVDPKRANMNIINQHISFDQLTEMLSFDATERKNKSTHWYQKNGKLISTIVKTLKTDKAIELMNQEELNTAIKYLKDFEQQICDKFFNGCPVIQSAIHLDETNPHIHLAILNHNGKNWMSRDISELLHSREFKKWEVEFDKKWANTQKMSIKRYLFGMKQKEYKNMKSYYSVNENKKYNSWKIGYAKHMQLIALEPTQEILRQCRYLLSVQNNLIKYEQGKVKHLIKYFDVCTEQEAKDKQKYFNEQVEEYFDMEVFNQKHLSQNIANEIYDWFREEQIKLFENNKTQTKTFTPKQFMETLNPNYHHQDENDQDEETNTNKIKTGQ